MKTPKLTKEHRNAFLTLTRKATAPAEAQTREQALKELLRAVRPVLERTWPRKDMAVLERHKVARRRQKLRLRVSGENGCSCVNVDLPADSYAHPVPVDPHGFNEVQTLPLQLESEAASAALAYLNAQDAARAANENLQVALATLVEEIVVPGRPLDNLDQLVQLWPDPAVIELAEKIKAGSSVLSGEEAVEVVKSAFSGKAA